MNPDKALSSGDEWGGSGKARGPDPSTNPKLGKWEDKGLMGKVCWWVDDESSLMTQ
jgi:hypothetical protein